MDTDQKAIRKTLEKLLKKVDDIEKDQRKLLTPEHAAQLFGFVSLKSDLEDIKAELTRIRVHLGPR